MGMDDSDLILGLSLVRSFFSSSLVFFRMLEALKWSKEEEKESLERFDAEELTEALVDVPRGSHEIDRFFTNCRFLNPAMRYTSSCVTSRR
uniref:Uncharacterized protein n=1 Tax=Vespula pensylvanica TaxID=30213 RepID=A0A834P6Y4_VESPE|nr:hypothetical protein H0235_006496 [Vespula pensylvanica]